ncbi:MAG: deoxyribose-phosphate aldolase [Thermaerobacter sp.]|nr:deoxyribose-phosphate aldolase [Thermaerobacter sp.]
MTAMKNLSTTIQHTLVRPDATIADIERVCRECVSYHFDAVMVMPLFLATARELLTDTDVKLATAVGFPMGGMTTAAKVFEVHEARRQGAQQVDFMPALSWLKSGRRQRFLDDMRAVVEAAEGMPVKVMLEFGLLTADEKRIAAELAIEAGAAYLKNSSGWGQGGQATVADIQFLKDIAQGRAKVKASGGIRTQVQALSLLEAGADLLGTSAGVQIVTGQPAAAKDAY